MVWWILLSSIILSIILLPALAWKWRISLKTTLIAALIIGFLTGIIVSRISYLPLNLNIAMLIIIELVLICLMPLFPLALRFYRDPERTPSESKNVILSPADGKIIYISKVDKASSLVSTKHNRSFRLEEITVAYLPQAVYLVGIDMNLLNVHVNRSPIAGKIVFQKHINGKFLSLRNPEAETLNERVTTIIDNGSFNVGVIQIASRLVRQIVSYLKEGDWVNPGQRIGMIRFGSQVDVAIPELDNLEIAVKLGDEVFAGVSILARYKSTSSIRKQPELVALCR